MFHDGQLVADKGVYSLSPPVPAVPESLSDSPPLSPASLIGTEGHEGQGVIGEDDWFEDLARTQEALVEESEL